MVMLRSSLSVEGVAALLAAFYCFAGGPMGSAATLCKERHPCRCTLSANDSKIELSGIGSKNAPRFANVMPLELNQSDFALYSFNPCFPFTEVSSIATTAKQNLPCVDAAACKLTPGASDGGPTELHSIALQSTAEFYESNEGIFITYSAPPTGSIVNVLLICDLSVKAAELAVVHVNGSVHNLTLTSQCACTDIKDCQVPESEDHKNGLSTGSVLLIIFFTLFAAYFIVGMTYNFCRGSTGLELIPNLEFWNGLPKLIMEGVAYTCSCFSRQRTTYGDL